jgi:hypothetical protein
LGGEIVPDTARPALDKETGLFYSDFRAYAAHRSQGLWGGHDPSNAVAVRGSPDRLVH